MKAHEDFHAFRLFLTDVGLIGAMGDLDIKTLLEGNLIFSEFKGALTEQFVLQQLITIPDIAIYYWSPEKSKSEIDFLIQYSGEIIPVEVKSEEISRQRASEHISRNTNQILPLDHLCQITGRKIG